MLLTVVIVLLLPDWAGTGAPRPLWVLATPAILGLIGAAFALKSGHLWWAAASALWGFVLLQILIIAVTLISGP